MAKFVPEDTKYPPIVVRRGNQVFCLVSYTRNSNGTIVPEKGYDITASYEHRRGKDAMEGIPLLKEYLRIRDSGEIAYQAAASNQGWGNSWSDLDDDEKLQWRQIAQSVLKSQEGKDIPFLY